VLNVSVLASDKYPARWDASVPAAFEIVNFVLTMLFTLELTVKLLSLGFRRTMHDAFNRFDAFIVAVSILDILVSPPSFLTSANDAPSSGKAATALRTFRLFRLLRLAKKWVSLRKLFGTIVKTFKDISNFTVLLCLVIYIMAMFGLSLFANRFHFDPVTSLAFTNITSPAYAAANVPRSNFDSLQGAVATVFQIVITCNWNNVMYDAYRSTGLSGQLYVLVVVTIGWLVLLNTFLSVLLVSAAPHTLMAL
jgi:Na+-transporting methylmalonyl-CoA/oxaloacetate decarboxylase gamma subunit